MIESIHSISQTTVLHKYFSQSFKLKLAIALHLSEPTIPNIILILKNSTAVWIKLKAKNLKLAFKRKRYYYFSNLSKFSTVAKFEGLPIPKQIKQVGFFPYANCIYHKNCYFKECLSFSSKSKNKLMTWHYRHLFS